MLQRKKPKDKGKVSTREYFKELKQGDKVAFVRNLSYSSGIPKRMQGKTGVVAGKQGKAIVVEFKEFKKEKKLIVMPIHLKKIGGEKNDNKGK
ncbi:50S ribosomal protein L21e [Candidatus Pacearchaeota archaeon CG_4_9_14_3_um_filter_31_7]|nr:MAG: hypothetical protein AUJ10_03220 [Candidatus Pacearchaeota archaeon CG1_02_31_27]PIN92416.1 MAG: 50S ribosomal protein L21e [Candidatus Pacearchaeota archaeon CG10_big_fil_rev_8_21_14_0_10_31_59]PIZ81001.1 MAG: 50S ribosomal protein L21e [Candidatus Pacearchaeota archaeon CG_4_10_14_0_2_um_filter_31_10]PJA70730.1 MAG: 50S ribosomal protein L21e [Candidatus Pacearchaeota archaeon CG_4_9_14_3_um_filter_31_7]